MGEGKFPAKIFERGWEDNITMNPKYARRDMNTLHSRRGQPKGIGKQGLREQQEAGNVLNM
jgi:hypothetical protein